MVTCTSIRAHHGHSLDAVGVLGPAATVFDSFTHTHTFASMFSHDPCSADAGVSYRKQANQASRLDNKHALICLNFSVAVFLNYML